MPRTLSYTLISLREMLLSSSPFALLTIGVIALAYWWLDPTPPKTVVLATGPAQSAYETFGRRYAQALEREGIHVELLASDGSSHNLALIRSGQADLGFVQGGTADIGADDQEAIVSLGSLFVEPLWLFYREARARQQDPNGRLGGLSDLKGWRVNVGSAGSGVPRLFATLLDINHLTEKDLRLSELDQTPATVAFLNGRLDALVFASAPESPMVQMLLQTPGVKLLPFSQGEAYSRRLPYLTPVLMPQGMVDLANNLPSRDVKLVATTTSLLANNGTHPAVLQLFAQTATELHGRAGWFSRARQYPNLEHSEVPIATEAERAIKGGPPFLQRHLPFWLANLIERMWLAMGLILALQKWKATLDGALGLRGNRHLAVVQVGVLARTAEPAGLAMQFGGRLGKELQHGGVGVGVGQQAGGGGHQFHVATGQVVRQVHHALGHEHWGEVGQASGVGLALRKGQQFHARRLQQHLHHGRLRR